MNEGAKTGIYWAAALVMLAVAIFVSWPPQTDSDTQSLIGQPLFPGFSDPLAASSLRIVTFDEGQGEVRRFEVAKDEATGVWSLPSRNNYPADASEQMQRAANALVGVKILDIQTENAEDHPSLGVVEPKPESLEVGDEGVGRLVSFRGDKNAALANIIIGNRVGDSGERRYVRIPQQDPVYVVNLEDAVFSTKFEDWIEKDLLQLSSIDIRNIEIESYDAALEGTGSVSLNRSYDAKLAVDGSNTWDLLSLTRYDEQQEPREVTLAEGETLASAKLNELKNALDDLKIVDVAAKPKGMSENLKADKDLVSDNEAVRSLAVRGFFPISSGDVISANGQMNVTLNDGVQYILRFGNVEGLSDAEGDATGGANRYLLVTAQVDDSLFPAPELKPIPKSIEELEELTRAEQQVDEPTDVTAPESPASPEPTASPESPASPEPAEEQAPATTEPPSPAEPENPASEPPAEPAAETPAEPATQADEDAPAEPNDAAAADEQAEPSAAGDEAAVSGDEITTGEGTAGGAGQGQDTEAAESAAGADAADQEEAAAADQPPVDAEAQPAPSVAEVEPPADQPAQANDADATPAAEPTSVEAPAAEPSTDPAPADETDEEKQERLEAEQEKITKENQRKLDERKDRIEAARRRVRELNGRFADWYYVIPESTYRQLRISLDDLIEQPAADEVPGELGDDASSAAPTFNFPAAP